MAELPPGVNPAEVPAGKPPAGVTPDLVHPPSLQPTTLGITITLMVLGIGFTLISLYGHRKRLRLADCMFKSYDNMRI